MATLRSGCRLPGTWTLREAGNGPVVTSGRSPAFRAVGIVSGTLDLPFDGDPGGCRTEGATRGARVFLSLRRHDPDQVQRVAAPIAASQPLLGHPLERPGC